MHINEHDQKDKIPFFFFISHSIITCHPAWQNSHQLNQISLFTLATECAGQYNFIVCHKERYETKLNSLLQSSITCVYYQVYLVLNIE